MLRAPISIRCCAGVLCGHLCRSKKGQALLGTPRTGSDRRDGQIAAPLHDEHRRLGRECGTHNLAPGHQSIRCGIRDLSDFSTAVMDHWTHSAYDVMCSPHARSHSKMIWVPLADVRPAIRLSPTSVAAALDCTLPLMERTSILSFYEVVLDGLLCAGQTLDMPGNIHELFK